jgi:SPP1 family predicted phage head-tail adaptor
MQTGELRFRVGFYRPIEADDGAGNETAGFGQVPEFTVAAAIAPKLGGESVLAGRLVGTNFANVTVRRSSKTAQVTTDWQAKDQRSRVIYAIRSIVDPDGARQWLEMLCEEGAAP